jgi:hypothetical protein
MTITNVIPCKFGHGKTERRGRSSLWFLAAECPASPALPRRECMHGAVKSAIGVGRANQSVDTRGIRYQSKMAGIIRLLNIEGTSFVAQYRVDNRLISAKARHGADTAGPYTASATIWRKMVRSCTATVDRPTGIHVELG